MFGRPPGPWEIGLILVIVLIVFGVGKLPQVGEALGKGMKAFRKGQTEEATPANQAELEATKAKLQATEAKLKDLEQAPKKS